MGDVDTHEQEELDYEPAKVSDKPIVDIDLPVYVYFLFCTKYVYCVLPIIKCSNFSSIF